MKKPWLRVVSAALSVCMMASVPPASAFAFGGGGSDVENSVISYTLDDNQMLSELLADGTGLPFAELKDTGSTQTLQSGIFYITQDVTLNGEKKNKNGLIVAANATVYLYIPAGKTLTVYGGNGTDADRAKGGSVKMPEFEWMQPVGALYVYMPSTEEQSYAGAPGPIATGGGAAIYVPENADLVVLGSGTLAAEGGSGGIASQGAQGMNTIFSFISEGQQNSALLAAPEPHATTNDPAWKMDIEDKGYGRSQLLGASAAQAGAGGTGGNGAGGGGAAIGTDGADGAEGSRGAETPMVVNGHRYDMQPAALVQGVTVQPAKAENAGNIYFADAIRQKMKVKPGEGGAACEEKQEETWTNGLDIDDTTEKYVVEAPSHYTKGGSYTYAEGNFTRIYVTNARRGGNGGAGGDGAAIGSGGAGGAGGTGGDSGSVTFDVNSRYPSYYSDTLPDYAFGPGKDGQDGTDGTPADTTLATENLPYNTVTFTGAAGEGAKQKYYLKNSTTITVPEYNGTLQPGESFKGWQVKTPGTALPEVFGETATQLIEGDATLYKPGAEITAVGIYGDVELEPKIGPEIFDIHPDEFVEAVTDENGDPLQDACAAQQVTITAKDRTKDGWEFANFTVTDEKQQTDVGVAMTEERTGTFAMPKSSVTVTTRYNKINYAVSVRGGKLTVNNGAAVYGATAQVEDKIAFTADEPAEGEVFTGWEFIANGKTVDASGLKITSGNIDEKTITLEMLPAHLIATAVFKPIAENDIIFTDDSGTKCGFAQVDGKTVTTAKTGDAVTITAAVRDGMEFDRWEVVSCEDADADPDTLLADASKERTGFIMPAGAVTFTAHYKPIEQGEPAQSGGDISKGEAAGIAAAAVGVGVAVWQGSELAMRIYRNNVIRINYWPGNRIQLAQLIWSRAGAPEPESDVPFADINEELDTLKDTNLNAQKAAHWCVEQGVLDAKTLDDGTECFEPAKAVSRLRVCVIWQNAKNKGLFDVSAETE